MSRSTNLTFALSLFATTLLVGCGSSDEPKKSDPKTTTATNKPAAGKASGATTKKPASTPPPQQKVSPTVGSNQSSAIDTAEVCTAADEGKGACVDDFVVFCAGGVLWALDCAAAFNGTCAEFDGTIDCAIPE